MNQSPKTICMVCTMWTSLALGATLNVPSAQYPTIQSGIDAAADGDTVQVAAGTFKEHLSWVSKRISLVGAGPSLTIVDGADSGRCLRVEGVSDGARLEGFTLQRGYGVLAGGCIYCFDSDFVIRNCVIQYGYANRGGGIYCEESAPTIENCTVSHNYPAQDGIGICCWWSAPTIVNCVISHNYGPECYGAGVSCMWSDATIVNCTISDNGGWDGVPSSGDGGGIFSGDSSTVIEGCTITNNEARWGGGVCIWGEGASIVRNCWISGNLGTRGGGIFCIDASPDIRNCLIADNTAWGDLYVGGGLYFHRSNATVTNCTVTRNWAYQGAGIFNWSHMPEVRNSIVAGNFFTYTPGEYCNNFGELQFHSCLVSEDPFFVDAEAGDFHLQDGSPCIDAGDNSYVNAGDTDLDGNPRVSGAAVDIGAYESPEPPAILEVTIDIKPDTDPPNPINPNSNGVIPVAILTTDTFDAADVDWTTVRLAGASVALRGKSNWLAHFEDVDGDGDDDLLVQVETSTGSSWAPGTVELIGSTWGGVAIRGYDTVVLKPE